MDGADPAGQPLELYVAETGGAEPRCQRFRLGKIEHRLWQVGIGVRMFRHGAPDRREHTPEVEQVEGTTAQSAVW